MPGIIRIQSVSAVVHVGHLLDYMPDAAHPRHEGVTIMGCYGLNCGSKAEFIRSIKEAEARRLAHGQRLLKIKAIHLLGGTTPGLVLEKHEREEMVQALLKDLPRGVQVIYVFHELPDEECEDYHLVVSGYDMAAGDRGSRLSHDTHPHHLLIQELNAVLRRIEDARSGGAQPRYKVAPWHLNRKRKSKRLIEQVEEAAAKNPEIPLSTILEERLHYPIVVHGSTKYEVITWDRIRPVSIKKDWRSQVKINRPLGEDVAEPETEVAALPEPNGGLENL
jgi:hypothetical protein